MRTQPVRNYSLYASEVGAESKNSSSVTPVTCFDVNGELQITVRWSRGRSLGRRPLLAIKQNRISLKWPQSELCLIALNRLSIREEVSP